MMINNFFSNDLLYQLILSRLSFKDLFSVKPVCKKWNQTIEAQYHAIFTKYFPAKEHGEPLKQLRAQLALDTDQNIKDGICISSVFSAKHFNVFSIRLTREDKILLGKNKGKIEVWNFEDIKPERVVKTREKNIHCMELDRMQRIVYVAGSAGLLLAYDLRSGKILDELSMNEAKKPITALALSRDEKKMAVGDDGPYVTVWDLNSQKCIKTFFQVYPTPNKRLVFSAKDQSLISRSIGNIVYSWTMDQPNEFLIIERGIMNDEKTFLPCYLKDQGIRRILALQELKSGLLIGIRNNFTKIVWENQTVKDRHSALRKGYRWSELKDAIQFGSFEKDGRFIALNQEGKVEILDFNPEWFIHNVIQKSVSGSSQSLGIQRS